MVGYFLSSNQPKEYPGYVSESPAPEGTKAFYTYLNDHYETRRWKHDPELLTKKSNEQMLIMIEPFFTPESIQMQEYINFMEAGNTILLLKSNPDAMFGLEAFPVMLEENESARISDQNGNEYGAVNLSSLRLDNETSDEVLLEDNHGVVALKREFGNGNLIVANSPNWLTNHYITKENHTELLISLFNNSTYDSVLVDEYIHGSGHAPSTAELYPKWLLVTMMQLILLLILWLWYRGKRFGPIYIPRESVVRFSNEQTSALAAWFERGRRYEDALHFQADYVKLLLQEKWGIPYKKDWEACTDLLNKRNLSMSEAEVNTLTRGLTERLNGEPINKKEFLSWSKKLDQLQREVEDR